MSNEKQLEQEIANLDAEARASLDKLADSRVELERLHRRTELAAQRRVEREQEAEVVAQEKLAEEARQKAIVECRKLAHQRHNLEAEAEKAMVALLGALDKLLPLEGRQNVAARGASLEASNDLSSVVQHWLETRLMYLLPQVSEFHELYHRPLHELDGQSCEPGGGGG